MADSLSKAIDFIIVILIIIGSLTYAYIKASIFFKLLGIFLIICLLIYLPGKLFEKKANEYYKELNK